MNQQMFKKNVFIHKDRLFRFALRFLLCKEDAQDIVQNVMLKLWEMRNKLTELENIEYFAMKLTKNQCLNHLKRMKIAENYIFENTNQNIEYQIDDNNLKEYVIELINALPECQRLVMHLKDIEEYEICDIAQILDMQKNTVRQNLARARQKIKQQLNQLFTYEQKQIQRIA